MKLFRRATISTIAGIISGELVFWVLLLGYLNLNRLSGFTAADDAGPMIYSLFLGFYLKPVFSGAVSATILLFSMRKSKYIPSTISTKIFEAAITLALVTFITMTGSIVLAAVEAKIPPTEIPDIYLLFLR